MPEHSALEVSAPTRLDFGGGWTDVPPYPEERGGFVCNLAIERRARVTLRAAADGPAPTSPTPPLLRAALDRAALSQLHATVRSDFPIGAGLGGSSAVGVAVAAALAAWRQQPLEPAALAEWSRSVEVDRLGIAGGRQDHYAAAYGGALGLAFARDVTVSSIPLSPETRTALEQRCLVYYTGESRISGASITAVLNAYKAKTPRIVFALDRMAALARLMATALVEEDVDALGALVGEHWIHQRSLHPAIATERIDALISGALEVGALGGKPLGASGGGCVVLIAPADAVPAVAAAADALAERLAFRVASEGVRIEPHR